MSWRHFLALCLLIAAVAAPAALATTYFLVTKDPRVRPLAITSESEAAALAFDSGALLTAEIEWGELNQSGLDLDTLAARITGAFYAHGEDVRIVTREVPGSTTVQLTYKMGANSFGPVPLSRAADGVRAAIDAFRLSAD